MNKPASDPTAPVDGLEVVLFQAGNQRCGLEAVWVRGAAPRPAADGGAIPELAAHLNLPAGGGERYVLTLRGRHGDWRLAVTGPIELARLPAAAIHPLPPLLAARCGLPGLRALGFHDDTPVLLLTAPGLEQD